MTIRNVTFAFSALLCLASAYARAEGPTQDPFSGTGQINVMGSDMLPRASAEFKGEAARVVFEALVKTVVPKASTVNGDRCRQVTGRGIACAEYFLAGAQTAQFTCRFAIEGQGIIHLPNPVLCSIPAGIGVSN